MGLIVFADLKINKFRSLWCLLIFLSCCFYFLYSWAFVVQFIYFWDLVVLSLILMGLALILSLVLFHVVF